MKRSEANRFVEKMTRPDQSQKKRLVQILKTYPGHFKSALYWVKVVNTFASETFDQASPSEQSGILRLLLQPIREKNRAHLLWELLEVYFGKEGAVIPAGVFVPSKFVQLLLRRFRGEDDYGRKKPLFEMLLLCDPSLAEGLTLEDCLIGLRHTEDLFRCRVLHFLYGRYREGFLSFILREIPLLKPDPSPMFYGTLIYFLRLHPEVNWVEEIENAIRPETSNSGLRMIHQAVKETMARHQAIDRIQPFPQGNDRKEEETVKDVFSRSDLTGMRLERFEKIGTKTDWR